ncbi:MAG UNVERIFIED_CONTAM: hypothetical protein LVR29_04135 [Microcystis novacekii LVE1205-3]|jgi:hypothetical protein
MKILAGDGEGDNFQPLTFLFQLKPLQSNLTLGSPENGFLEETRFLNKGNHSPQFIIHNS